MSERDGSRSGVFVSSAWPPPTSLSSTSSQLTNALTTLCTSSYPTFLSLHTSTSSLHSSLDTFSTSLSTLLDTLPALESSSKSFSTQIKHVQSERQKASLVLDQSSKLNDILEPPFLTETCILNGFYAEALDLHCHAAALAFKFPDVRVVADVKAEVDGAIRGLVQGLVGTLREPGVKLPALWKAVGFLRKMGVFGVGEEGEEELAVAFLSGRGECLEAALRAVGAGMEGEVGVGLGVGASVGKEGWVRYLKKYMDMWREGVHDVVTQFSTIFLTPSTSSTSTGTSTPPKTLTPLPLRPSTPTLSSPTSSTSPRTPSTFILTLLPTFTSNAIHTHLLPTLHTVLPHIQDPSSLTSLLTQLTYCATSFSRIGLDFRGLLGPIFEDTVRWSVESALKSATEEFVTLVQRETQLGTRTKGRRLPSAWLVSTTPLGAIQVPQAVQANVLDGTPAHVPPHMLTSYPPLAVYVNAILTTFNSWRLLAPAALLPVLLSDLDEALATSGEVLLNYVRIVEDGLSGAEGDDNETETEKGVREKEVFVVRRAGEVWVRVLVPFLRRGMSEGVYGAPLEVVDGEDGEERKVGEKLERVMVEWRSWLEGGKEKEHSAE
ncbi:Dor1-domain-containing protein [Stereum hirsutum FP-91666 SS1]|uniref:Conserved oligomeric Golgi complex subunit 8 n=1 Tax=Stereum hirsutum (strain FP-91666) TaxID=721885 RepID=R7RXI6_STEHR|nr:Dor1-domain-containing protein [Stereum hirsutum FP-91666 SS1]EIM80044.1 Dor1-domain-containing protein [Stereum hirsutum FP-91666 SS1]